MLANTTRASRWCLGAAMICFCLLGPSRGAAARDLIGSRAQGMGGSLRAAALGPTSLFLNPAGMSLANMYVASALYQYRGSDSAHQLSAAVVDSVTSRYLAAGLYYNFITATPKFNLAGPGGPTSIERSEKTHETGLALSIPLGQWLIIGVTGRYINVSSELNDGAPAGTATPDIGTLTMDVGGTIRLGAGLSIAVVGYNLIPVDDTFPEYYPQALGLGAAYALGQMATLSFDTVLDFSSDPNDEVKASFHGGAEVFFGKQYALRGGAMHDMLRDSTYVSGGLALVSRRLGLEFSLRQQVDGGSETLLAFALNLFVQ